MKENVKRMKRNAKSRERERERERERFTKHIQKEISEDKWCEFNPHKDRSHLKILR